MTRTFPSLVLAVALLAAPALIVPGLARAEAGAAPTDVARAFMAAARAQDRQGVLQLLDREVLIEFPSAAADSRIGQQQGQPFVIGYLDGLFDGERGLSLDGTSVRGDAVRFLAHDARSKARYVIDVQVKNQRVVRVTIDRPVDRQADAGIDSAL
jgi:hypothetical protein